MAIGFARVEFIKRSEGRNSCQLSAYLSRSRIEFEGNTSLAKKTYDYSYRENAAYATVLLPKGANENFAVPEVLWNAVEKKENRKDSQVATHLVLALPDNDEISDEDRIRLAESFVKEHYVDQGFAAELVVHPPNRQMVATADNEALGIKKGERFVIVEKRESGYLLGAAGKSDIGLIEVGLKLEGFKTKDHNWHAHVLIPTRRLKEQVLDFEDKKAVDMMPVIRKGKVISGPDNGKAWAIHQK